MSKKRADKSRPPVSKPSSPKSTRAGAKKARGVASPPDDAFIAEVIARGDPAEMRRVAASARRWLKDFQAELDALRESVRELGG